VRGSRPDPDPDVIRQAQRGEEESLRALLKEVSPTVRQWALASTGDPEEAADLTQEVLILLVRKLSSYRGDARFLTWLFSVTRNQALESQRKAARYRIKMERLAKEVDAGMDHHPPQVDLVDRRRLGELISTFLKELPVRQREVFQMAEIQGLSSPEISGILGVEAGTVRAALFKARRTLRRKILEQSPEFAEEYLP
jgi:RNA polymerase sigma-70 factor (ECF subfamily)